MVYESAVIVQKLWSYCHVLRDDGMSYGDYLEQLTYLLFLKMADERTKPPFNEETTIPKKYDWQSLLNRDGAELEEHYKNLLSELAKKPGMLGMIFRKSQNKFRDPAKLKRVIADLIDKEVWTSLEVDVKGAAYEGLLEKNAEDVKSGAGQYFTPRPLIQAIVDVMRPEPGMRICDPACGTGGFLLAAHDYIAQHYKLNPDDTRRLKEKTLFGWELVDDAARLCLMNLFLHGIGGKTIPITVGDSLSGKSGDSNNMVLTNPPFGKKSSFSIVNGDGEKVIEDTVIVRDDFWASTSNKQLNFVQHVYTILKETGRAAVVIPDNVLFEGGAGETIRKRLLHVCDVHTLLRLPTGIFYRPGVKANVIFFDARPGGEKPQTDKLWIYDFRTNMHFTLKTAPLKRTDLDDFVSCYNPQNRYKRKETDRFKAFSYNDLIKRDKANLDIFWLKDESLEDTANLPPPDVLAAEIVEDLQAALEQFQAVLDDLSASKRT